MKKSITRKSKHKNSMKRLFTLVMAVVLPLCAMEAQGLFSNKEYEGGRQPRETYMHGAVPESAEGKIEFTKTIEAAGQSKFDLYLKLSQWANFRYNPSTERGRWNDADYFKNSEYARIVKASAEDGFIKIQGNEDMVFTNKTLAKDMAIVSYTLEMNVVNGKVTATIKNISYTYSLTDTPERIEAEDWITDKEAITKSGKLNKGSGKFRVKTIDLKDELFKEIEEAVK